MELRWLVFKFFTVFLTAFLVVNLVACEKSNSMNINQPSYFLKLKMNECPRSVAVNGVEIEQDYAGDANYTAYPINPYIRNGKNTFELIVGEQEDMEESTSETTECIVEIRVKGEVNGEEVDFLVADIRYSPDYLKAPESLYVRSSSPGNFRFEGVDKTTPDVKGSDAVVGDVYTVEPYIEGIGHVFKREFTANTPFPEWMFFSGEKVFDYPMTDDSYDQMKDVVWPMVQELWNLFETKDIDKVMPLFEMRSKEYDQAFYREEGETYRMLKNSIENRLGDKYFLDRVDRKQMQLMVSFTGQLVTVVNAGSMKGAVVYTDDDDFSVYYDAFWMRKEGKWIIAR